MAERNSIQVFNSPQFGQVRTAGTSDNPLFCLADLCKAVGLSNPSSVKARLDAEDVQLIDLHALNSTEGTGTGNTISNFVTESGFYDVLLQSSSPKVKPFRKWVTSEVLPSIRKTGGYIASSAEDTPEEIMARAYIIAQDTIKRKDERIALQQQTINEQQSVIDRQAPDVAFAQTIKASGTNILIGDFAKVLASNNYIIGQNRLFEWLRANKFLDERNVPMQRYLEMGLFVIEEKPVGYHSDGRAIVRITPRITPKGQEYIITRLNDGRLYIPRKIKTA